MTRAVASADTRTAGTLWGAFYGVIAVVMWAAYLAYSRAGIVSGLTPSDLAFVRFATAAALMLPWMMLNAPRSLAGVGWWRGIALALAAGPAFVLLSMSGYRFAPLSHGAVIQPSVAALVTLMLGWVLLNEPVTRARIVGTAVLIFGISLIASRSFWSADAQAWIGDLLFVCAGLCWVAFTVMLKHWRLDGVSATAAVSVVSGLMVVPAFLVFDGFERLAAAPVSMVIMQVLVQGVCAGVLALIAFGRAVEILGAGRAGLFPALVPAATLLVGIPITGEVPGPVEILGAVMATMGLAIALGAVRFGRG